MAEITKQEIKELLTKMQGQTIALDKVRHEFSILSGSKSFDLVRNYMWQLASEKIVRALGNGSYKVITEVKPVSVFGRERRPPIEIRFPKDYDSGMEMLFAEDIILREGDMILLAGRSNFGKTTLCMNFCGENIDHNPVLMGNEYTTLDHEPSPRFLNRLDTMDWVRWDNGTGEDKFTLLPVRSDYAEHIVKDSINIIDWINIDTGEHYLISSVMEGIKKELGRGIGIIAIQKAEGTESGRGGQFTKDFADCELLLDQFGDDEVLLKIGKVKEYKKRVVGRTFAYAISQGVKIINFREVVKCASCHGKGWLNGKPCEECYKKGYVDK